MWKLTQSPMSLTKPNMDPGKADPTGHELDHISHLRGVGHDHDSTGFQQGIGHHKWHKIDNHDDHDGENHQDNHSDQTGDDDTGNHAEPPAGSDLVDILFNQPPLSEDMPQDAEDADEPDDEFDLI